MFASNNVEIVLTKIIAAATLAAFILSVFVS